MIMRAFPNVITAALHETKDWYVNLLDWHVEFDSDWFVHLRAPEASGAELGIINASSDIVVDLITPGSPGVMLTIVVEDVDVSHRLAMQLGYEILQPPVDLFYGQRRMILRDPNGTVVDISSECEPSQQFLDSLSPDEPGSKVAEA